MDVFERPNCSHMLFKRKTPVGDLNVKKQQQALQLGVAALVIVIPQCIVKVVGEVSL